LRVAGRRRGETAVEGELAPAVLDSPHGNRFPRGKPADQTGRPTRRTPRETAEMDRTDRGVDDRERDPRRSTLRASRRRSLDRFQMVSRRTDPHFRQSSGNRGDREEVRLSPETHARGNLRSRCRSDPVSHPAQVVQSPNGHAFAM
jgi:hypothetical protein